MKKLVLSLVALFGMLFASGTMSEARPHKAGDQASASRHVAAARSKKVTQVRNAKYRKRAVRTTQAHRRTASHSRRAMRPGHAQRRSAAHSRRATRVAQGLPINARFNAGPRPGKWCGWWMRTQLGGGPEFNVAWNWRKYGRPTSPQVGAVVVWRRHVGIITGQASNGRWIVKSGNDGGRVRERARSVAGAIFRI